MVCEEGPYPLLEPDRALGASRKGFQCPVPGYQWGLNHLLLTGSMATPSEAPDSDGRSLKLPPSLPKGGPTLTPLNPEDMASPKTQVNRMFSNYEAFIERYVFRQSKHHNRRALAPPYLVDACRLQRASRTQPSRFN
jgi:hypothetical protein